MTRRRFSPEEIRAEVAQAIAEREDTPAEEFVPNPAIGFGPLRQMSECCRVPMEAEYCTSCGEPARALGRPARARAAGAA